MTRIGNPKIYDSRSLARMLSFAATLAVGCASQVDLGGSVSLPDPVSNDHELAAQTTNLAKVNAQQLSSLAIDAEFLYFSSAPAAPGQPRLWRCRKSDCWATMTAIASAPDHGYSETLGLNAGRLKWLAGMCDAPDCTNRVSDWWYAIWDERFGYWFDAEDGAIYRCDMADCVIGTAPNTFAKRTLVASRAKPRDFTLAGDQLYWLDAVEGMTRASVDGATPAERLTVSSVTAWTTSRAGLQLAGDVAVADMELDGAYIYAALNVSNHDANATLGCDTCTPGIAIARWQHAIPGAAREWVLMNDADLTDLIHLRVFDGEVIWGTANGSLWSCLANDCSASKRQIGVNDAMSKVVRPAPTDPSRVDPTQTVFQFIAVDEQAIFWLSAPCYPRLFECSPTGNGDWTLKRTPRIAP